MFLNLKWSQTYSLDQLFGHYIAKKKVERKTFQPFFKL